MIRKRDHTIAVDGSVVFVRLSFRVHSFIQWLHSERAAGFLWELTRARLRVYVRYRYVSDGDDARIQRCCNLNIADRLVALLAHDSSAVVTPALRVVGNMISGNDQQTQYMLNAGAMPAIFALLNHVKVNIKKEACWALSNIAAGTAQQATALVNYRTPAGRPGIYDVIRLAFEAHHDVRKEALWTLANVCTGGNVGNIRVLVEAQPVGVVEVLCGALKGDDSRIQMVGLEGLEAVIFRYQPRIGKPTVRVLMERCGGVELVEQLESGLNDEVSVAAGNVLARLGVGSDSDSDDDDDDDGEGQQQ